MIETLLKEHYGLDVRFSETGIICIEKPRGTGEAIDIMGAADNPCMATVGFLVEPGPAGSGITYKSTVIRNLDMWDRAPHVTFGS